MPSLPTHEYDLDRTPLGTQFLSRVYATVFRCVPVEFGNFLVKFENYARMRLELTHHEYPLVPNLGPPIRDKGYSWEALHVNLGEPSWPAL